MIAALLIASYVYTLWLLFLAVMALQWRWRELTKPVKVFAAPAVLVAVLLDVLFNVTIGTVLFLEPPFEWTFSQRIGTYKQIDDWRRPIAVWICANLLDPFEAGGHCKG